jgi:hypothetical protein
MEEIKKKVEKSKEMKVARLEYEIKQKELELQALKKELKKLKGGLFKI